jgi:hypothetical protein
MLKEIEINVNDTNLFIMHCTCTLNCQAVPINVYKKTTRVLQGRFGPGGRQRAAM